MSIKSISNLNGVVMALVLCTLCPPLDAIAASFDKYIVAPIGNTGTTYPSLIFQVKASDSATVEYLRFIYGGIPMPSIVLSPSATNDLYTENSVYRTIGVYNNRSANYEIKNISFSTILSQLALHDPEIPGGDIYLFREVGTDADGHIKLFTETIPDCVFLICSPITKTYTAFRDSTQRMTTLNGDQIEVIPVVVQLDNLPWATYYFGYGAGLVAVEVFNNELVGIPSFTPVTLPQPQTEGTVVEYVNTIDFPNEPGGHYFYTAAPGEQAKVDAGSAGHFVRTGLEFASGGFVPVCRFYGSMSPGPNSHFFTASEAECQWLQSLQATPIPTDVQQWNYEGIAFYSVVPVRDAEGQKHCMTGTAPVYRAYNNAYPKEGGKNPWDSNHRYSTNRSVMDGMVAQGWRDEGIVLCAPLN